MSACPSRRGPRVAARAHTPSSSGAAGTRFSAWTPLTNQLSNQQLFQERLTLILHWFDLWTDVQRKHVFQLLLRRCSKSQLRSISAHFIKSAPVVTLDFTTVLPRALSLYILSFLNPMDLCAAAQVCWHWRFLSEQDCLWAPKCIRQGWFLTYGTSDNEYGAWKKHYVACACNLDFLSPRKAADIYGTLNEPLPESEEEEEKRTESLIRRTICEKIVEHKKADLKNRRAWLTNSKATYASSMRQKSSLLPLSRTISLVQLGDKCRLETRQSLQLQTSLATNSMNTLAMNSHLQSCTSSFNHPPSHLLLLSSRLPAYEMLLCGALVNVVPLLYDYSGMTLEALLCLAERAIKGRAVQSVGIIAEGNSEEVHLIEGLSITEKSILNPDVRTFWEKLSGWVVPASEAGSLNIFVPLAASVAGMALINRLSTLTGLSVRVPTGICTGSYQHILSEWLGDGDLPPLLYLSEEPLVSWCRQAEWIELTLQVLRKQLEPQLHILSNETRGRTLGLFLWDHINLPVVRLNSDVMQVVIEGLVALFKETTENPLEFLGKFLLRKNVDGAVKKSEVLTESRTYSMKHEVPKSLLGEADRRRAVFMELLNSENAYVRLLQAVHTVYYLPLRAALDSNRAIISSANLVMLFNPILDILEANNVFLQDLTERSRRWSPVQCVGDVFIRFCGKLRAYTNFFNNYSTAIRTIDKCKEVLPVFRAFLKRNSRTSATRMLSLQELFLSPSGRVEEYVTLLQSLMLNTPPEHPDHTHVSSALNTLWNYGNFIKKLKKSSNQEEKILEVQKIIQSCPNLQEGGRYLITKQDAALLSCISEDVSPSLRMYECVKELGLFLFNDVVVLTEKRETHAPFSLAVNTSHTFLASVSLHSLAVSDVLDTKYVQNSFLLESPNRQWTCATDREEDKIRWMCALSSAINAAKHN
ncbi:epithelial cell-transforming sequence 2 oncogene-like [Clarias gariepinus]|uniref:epithelial cell-transforming sequence 2 oncogene-like n=1 Tax=Clarias gariepinus TaxID=13013 RepID=UPI00234C70DA|nr:epithelial cell-transforming sequence 2 oncogene-like [Clarias gariepinus]